MSSDCLALAGSVFTVFIGFRRALLFLLETFVYAPAVSYHDVALVYLPGLGKQGFIVGGYDYKVKLSRKKFEARYGPQKCWSRNKSIYKMYDWGPFLQTHQIGYMVADGSIPVQVLWLYTVHYHREELVNLVKDHSHVEELLSAVARTGRSDRWVRPSITRASP